jgi:hypothetical protein
MDDNEGESNVIDFNKKKEEIEKEGLNCFINKFNRTDPKIKLKNVSVLNELSGSLIELCQMLEKEISSVPEKPLKFLFSIYTGEEPIYSKAVATDEQELDLMVEQILEGIYRERIE